MIVVHGLVTADGRLACWAETTDHADTPSTRDTAPTRDVPPGPDVSSGWDTAAADGSSSGAGAAGRDTAAADGASSGADIAPGAGAVASPGRSDRSDGPDVGGHVAGGTPSPRHPFAVLPPLPGTVATADLVLPSTPARPAASPELAEHLPKRPGTAARPQPRRQSRWTVPIVILPPAIDPETLLSTTPDARPGSSIGYLADVTMFATSLVDRGRVLPTVTTQPRPLRAAQRPAAPTPAVAVPAARWRPALWGADAATFDALCRAMPGVAAAAGSWSTAEATTAAVHAAVDALVRTRLRHRPVLREGQVRHDTVVRSWLAALTTSDARLRTAPTTSTPAAIAWPEPPTDGPATETTRPSRAGSSPAALSAPDAAGPWATETPDLEPPGSANAPGAGDECAAADHRAPRLEPKAQPADRTTTHGGGDAPAAASDRSGLQPHDSDRARGPHGGPATAGHRTIRPAAAAMLTGAASPTTPDATAFPGGAAASDGSLPIADGPEVERLREVVERWADSGRPAAVRTCFRLTYIDDPDDDQDDAPDGTGTVAEAAQDGAVALAGAYARTAAGAPDRANGGEADRDGRESDGWGQSDRWGDGDELEDGGPDGDGYRDGRGYRDRPEGGGHRDGRGDGDRPQGGGYGGADSDGGGSWLVEFLLQPADEPGLLVPAADVWRDGSSPLFRWVDYPQDVLLADLGRASRLWPDLDDALHVARPELVRLDTAGAYRFLQHASLLHDAGFGVLLPAQWQRRQELGLTLTVRARQPAAPVLRDTTTNRNAIFAYRWGLAIGDEFLSKADLTALARAKVPLVRLRGRWVHLDRERLAAGLAFLRRGGTGEITAGEAIRLTRLVPDGDLPLPVTGVDGSGWLADLLTGRAVERLELLDPPRSLTATLRPYQRRGLSWLAFLDSLGVGALLADDMGLGKTVQLLALEALLRERGKRPPTLIVCPLSVLGNWRREIERFTPGLRVVVHHGSARPGRGGTADFAGADLVLTTYQVATRDVDTLAGVGWDRVVLDEAQHVKNATGVTARAVRRLPARHRVALTGTPVENRLTELWSIADFLNPGLLGEASIFRARYSVPIERWGDADAARRLRRVTRPFLLRRVKTDRAVIADLPEKFERRQWCNLTLEQATLYKAVVNELFVKLREGRAGPQRKGLVLSAMTKLKQVCNHPAHLMGDGTPLPGRSGKLARLEEILAAAREAGDRALVFTQFARFGHLLVPHLAERLATPVEFLHGGTPKGARDRMVERFQSGAGPGVLLVSLKAGGTGLNLTAANHVVHVDRWWNPAAEAQATDRAFRIGQRRDVQVHTFVCIGTIEERVEHIMAGKRGLAGVAVGSGEGWLTGLSTDDLLELMSLSPEAVEDA
ncbi:SNF2-related protein [Dactylosporangium sp. CA-139066]|uniref:DEAD/DEAH box helicase n=1 Tax=Dactylosporangium sp. CA-139066 TaxID=3239930 RepID=UPI003D93836D